MLNPIIYGFPHSTFVNIVRLMLLHKEAPYTFHDLEQDMGEPSELALHPFNRVPNLRYGDFTVYETSAIVAHVDKTNRRTFILGAAGVAACLGIGRRATAQSMPAGIQAVLKTLIGEAVPIEGRISLEIPEIAENGNTIPYMVTVESPMTDAEFVKAVHILAPANPHPQVASFFFTPQSGKAAVSSRMRLGQTQDVLAIAELSDGRVYVSKRSVKVTVGGCGG